MLKRALAVCCNGFVLFAVLLRASLRTGCVVEVGGERRRDKLFFLKFADRGEEINRSYGGEKSESRSSFSLLFLESPVGTLNPGPLLMCDGSVCSC